MKSKPTSTVAVRGVPYAIRDHFTVRLDPETLPLLNEWAAAVALETNNPELWGEDSFRREISAARARLASLMLEEALCAIDSSDLKYRIGTLFAAPRLEVDSRRLPRRWERMGSPPEQLAGEFGGGDTVFTPAIPLANGGTA